MTRSIRNIIAALDIGASKVVAVIAEALPNGRFEALGLGQYESSDMRQGMAIHIGNTANAVQRAVEKAESMAGCKIREVYVSVAGSHAVSFNSSGMTAVKNKEVSAADVDCVMEAAASVNVRDGQQILHVLPQEFFIDGRQSFHAPIGMKGLRLESLTHIVTGSMSMTLNIIQCMRRCELKIQDLILQPLASGLACLSAHEREQGVVLIDIGASATDVAIFTGGAIRHTAILPIAGDQLTSNIAAMLRVPKSKAEEIKRRHGIAKKTLARPDEIIDAPGFDGRGPRQIKRQALGAVIELRAKELFNLARREVCESGYEDLLPLGVAITGGTAWMPGLAGLAEDVLMSPARVAAPEYEGSLADVIRNPRFSTVVGVLQEACAQRLRGRQAVPQVGGFEWVLQRMRDGFKSE